MTDPQLSAEWERLSTASSIVEVISSHVDDLAPRPVRDALPSLGSDLPAGWQVVALSGGAAALRVVLTGQRADGGWDGCETLRTFTFTGTPPADIVADNIDTTLHDLDAEGIFTYAVTFPPHPGLAAARSSGYVTVAGRSLWARYSTYLHGSLNANHALLVQHVVFVDTHSRTRLGPSIGELTDHVERAFLASIDAHPTHQQRPPILTAKANGSHGQPAEASAVSPGESIKSVTHCTATALTEEERHFIAMALRQWRSAASYKPFLISEQE
jgi:hypothetical protein